MVSQSRGPYDAMRAGAVCADQPVGRTLARAQQALTVRRDAWYAKECVTFSDTLAMVRRWLWAEQQFQLSQTEADMMKVPRAFLERLTETLCYAA